MILSLWHAFRNYAHSLNLFRQIAVIWVHEAIIIEHQGWRETRQHPCKAMADEPMFWWMQDRIDVERLSHTTCSCHHPLLPMCARHLVMYAWTPIIYLSLMIGQRLEVQFSLSLSLMEQAEVVSINCIALWISSPSFRNVHPQPKANAYLASHLITCISKWRIGEDRVNKFSVLNPSLSGFKC